MFGRQVAVENGLLSEFLFNHPAVEICGLVGNPSCTALQTCIIRKPVSQVDWSPLRRGLVDAVSKINDNAWHDPGLYARPLPLDRPMHVTTYECPDLRVTANDSL